MASWVSFTSGNSLRQVEPRAAMSARVRMIAFARIHADGGADVAAGDAEVQRIQLQHARVELQVRVHVVDRQLTAH